MATVVEKPQQQMTDYQETVWRLATGERHDSPDFDELDAAGKCPSDFAADLAIAKQRLAAVADLERVPAFRAEWQKNAPAPRPTDAMPLSEVRTVGDLRRIFVILNNPYLPTAEQGKHLEEGRSIDHLESAARDLLRRTCSAELKAEEIAIRHGINTRKQAIADRRAKRERDAKRRAELRVELERLAEQRGVAGVRERVNAARMAYARLSRVQTPEQIAAEDAKDQTVIDELTIALAENDAKKMTAEAMGWT